jgi:hypothetical protein
LVAQPLDFARGRPAGEQMDHRPSYRSIRRYELIEAGGETPDQPVVVHCREHGVIKPTLVQTAHAIEQGCHDCVEEQFSLLSKYRKISLCDTPARNAISRVVAS